MPQKKTFSYVRPERIFQRSAAPWDFQILSAAAGELQPHLPDVEYAAKKQTFDYGAASSGYISPSENSAPQGTFSGYSESDKNALLRHIEDEKKRLSATQMPEHEKVSWDKVKQYNSAILSVGEIDESDDKK